MATQRSCRLEARTWCAQGTTSHIGEIEIPILSLSGFEPWLLGLTLQPQDQLSYAHAGGRMVRGSKKKRAHSETSTPASASIPPKMSASPVATSTLLVTLAPFSQLLYSNSAPISTPSYAGRILLRPAPSSSARPLAPHMLDVDYRILILSPANRYMS
ncbi:hypothetical protein M9H77_07153 [Catharanthus roseus]|uniref:Uncharacterized protein n=1 Tax=Catharanthus roseus TaxID=4058 RepID=A0ACC0BUF1_CATRO|nr:hypothetical protein M9H77_07153 [Catharanthus roseus]